MRLERLASKTLGVILWVILGIVLLVMGIAMVLYSAWGQNYLRRHLLTAINSTPGTEVAMDSLRLRFPLDLNVSGLSVVQNGDTMIAASEAKAKVRLLPLLRGRVAVDDLSLRRARYQMGNADSLMMMVIAADTIDISPATVTLGHLDIDVADGRIAHGLVSLTSRPDTATQKPAPAESSPMTVRVRKMQLTDFTYQMRMLPSIDSLGATVGQGTLSQAVIDLGGQSVKIGYFGGARLDAAYIAPDSAQIADTPVPPVVETDTKPWTVEIDSIHFTDSHGLYTTHGLQPLPGLDFAYIEASDMDLAVHDFYNQATTLSLPITLTGRERCGVDLDAKGTFAMDSTAMYFRNFSVSTPQGTHLQADGMLGVGDMLTDPALPMRLAASGDVSIPDLKLMFPAFGPYLAGIPATTPVELGVDLSGTAGDLSIADLMLKINRTATLHAKGDIAGMFDAKGPSGDLTLSGSIVDVKSIIRSVMADAPFAVPPMTLSGHVSMRKGDAKGNLKATALGGHLALAADVNTNSQGYDVNLNTDQFPLGAFLPGMDLGNATVQLKAAGKGFDVFSPKTVLDAHGVVKSLVYNKYDYRGLTLDAKIGSGRADVNVVSSLPDLDASVHASGNLDGSTYVWKGNIHGDRIDLKALNFSETPATVEVDIDANASITPATGKIDATAVVNELAYADETADYMLSNIRAAFAATDTLTTLRIVNRDFMANAEIPYGIDSISAKTAYLSEIIDKQIRERHIRPDSLQQAIPQFSIYASGGADNFINDILSQSKMSIRRFELSAANDTAISMRSRVTGLRTQSIKLDTIGLDINQRGSKINMNLSADNRPGTFDNFAHVRLNCILYTNRIALRAWQKDIHGVTGYDLGSIVTMTDSIATLKMFPLTPVIGYKNWQVNLDNFISYQFYTHQIDANLRMKGEKSSLALYTEAPADTTAHNAIYNDVVLKINDIQIADWISINPFAPPIAGDLSADMRVQWDGSKEINGTGHLYFNDFYYDRQRVGSFTSNLGVATSASGSIRANANLLVDGQEAMTFAGCLNDSTATSPLNIDFKLIKFPMSVANPFLPDGMVRLSGTLNGAMQITGDSERPLINGDIYFDKAAALVAMTNTQYAFSDVKIPVVDNIIKFNDFGISGTNENPLLINGTVDIRSLVNPRIDLTLKASNMMVVNSQRAAKNAEIYGKGYLDLDASVAGDLSFLKVDADVKVLAGTNVTYVMTAATNTLQAPSETDMVKFVNFTDSTLVEEVDTVAQSEMMMMLTASLAIQSGTTINVDLSSNARDKVQVQPTGNLEYTLSPMQPDGRLTGRININNGFARYNLPVIGSEKSFTFTPGSFIAFNGDILNPVLNINATDVVKANVTQSGQNSRLVNFDIGLSVTGTLETMDVKFDLSTTDDLTVANELQSMSAEQRANQAMNLLLYNIYTGPGTKGNANLGANPLYSFLESQVNAWAANNIKGVDLSFGIDQYNQTTNGSTSSTMSYSYQVSKQLFNDRFKIVVGGNYTTDADPDENLSENLINDISFEYFLNQQQTMLLKLFRHTGYESILEGEITKTGVGFVYKRKLSRLVQMLPRFMRPKKYRKII